MRVLLDNGTRLQRVSQWPQVRLHLEKISAAVNASTPGSYTEVEIAFISGAGIGRIVA
jgi:hypothetical protein